MLSLDRFYKIVHANLIGPFDRAYSQSFYPFGTYDGVDILHKSVDNSKGSKVFQCGQSEFFHCYFFDQEPVYDTTAGILDNAMLSDSKLNRKCENRINIFANSEKSNTLNDLLNIKYFYNWYYFFHGFAALDWFRDLQYLPPQCFNQFDKVFICYNHITTKYRSYRLHLVSNLLSKDLVKFGHVSLFHRDSWKSTVIDPNNLLDSRARITIYKTLKDVSNNLIIDTDNPCGSMSANINIDQLTSALWHVVTETVYFLPKLHLTEKVFKPIVAKRPFILVAAPGNLAYLKSYGFKTFDRWVNESYDLEQDNYLRIEKITTEIEKLCALSPAELKQMHREMQEVLEYNFNHFYGEFRKIITNELVDNFASVLAEINHPDYQHSPEYLQSVKQRLLR